MAAVFQPENVKPARVNVSAVNAAATLLTSLAIEPVPPLLLNVTVWFGSAVHWANIVASAVNGYEAACAQVGADQLRRGCTTTTSN